MAKFGAVLRLQIGRANFCPMGWEERSKILQVFNIAEFQTATRRQRSALHSLKYKYPLILMTNPQVTHNAHNPLSTQFRI